MLRAEREKLRKGALERMREAWVVKAKTMPSSKATQQVDAERKRPEKNPA
jgi:hypothetical protein